MPGPGRPPKPLALKLLTGKALPKGNAVVDFPPLDAFPDPPQHLNPDGAKFWNELGPELLAAGVLRAPDLHAFSQLAYCWQRHLMKAKAGMDICAAEDAALRNLFVEFGLTPSARRRVSADGNEHKGNRFNKYKQPQTPGAAGG